MTPKRAPMSVLDGILPGVNGKSRAAARLPAPAPPRARVRWIPGQLPGSEEEKILHDALTQAGLQTLRDVRDYLADTLYWRDFLRGGLVADMSLLRAYYNREARETIEKLHGTLLTIEEE